MLRRLAPLSCLLLTACAGAMPLNLATQPGAPSAVTTQSTQGALALIEEMAHASLPDHARIEAAFQIEISRSTRPSLKKILAQAAESMAHHPIADPDPRKHPVAKLVRLAAWRYNWLMGENLISRVFELFNLVYASPEQQPALARTFETRIRNTPKLDVNLLLTDFNAGHYDDLIPVGSPLRNQLETILKTRLAAR
ncbi:MAG: hypothetical protein AB7I41_14285 [Candidatus Sericytochromatia bacterium]